MYVKYSSNLHDKTELFNKLFKKKSAFDEYFLDFSNNYEDFRNRIRNYYKYQYKPSERATHNGFDGSFNPGGCWVSNVCFAPKVASNIIEEILNPFTSSGILTIWRGYSPIGAEVNNIGGAQTLTSVEFIRTELLNQLERNESELEAEFSISANITVDCTELGDLFNLLPVNFTFGVESQAQTGEPGPFSFSPFLFFDYFY